jgi:hypothetical protein
VDDIAKLALREPVNTRVLSTLNFVATLEVTVTDAEPAAIGSTIVDAKPDRPSRVDTITIKA